MPRILTFHRVADRCNLRTGVKRVIESLKELLKFLPLLLLSAVLEVGGDAGMRLGLQGKRAGFIVGAISLILYGLVVNLPKWDFGRLLGVYVAVFFIVAQAIGFIVYKEKLNPQILVGGALIVSGGLVLSLWQPNQTK